MTAPGKPSGRSTLARRAVLGLGIFALLTGAGVWLMHSGIDPAEDGDGGYRPPIQREDLAAVKSWGYQLQRLDVATAARSRFDLLVIDEAFDGRVAPADRQRRLARLKAKPDGSRRIVLAYLSIGEAESYRPYWQSDWVPPRPEPAATDPTTGNPPRVDPRSRRQPPATAPTPAPGSPQTIVPAPLPAATPAAPAWLGPENPEWKGNYSVRFWDAGWQALMLGTPQAALDRLLAAGFDGVYLDRADVYGQWRTERENPRADMIAFITQLSDYARTRNPNFLICMQNAEELLSSRKLVAALDLVAKEDLLFGVTHSGQPNPPADIEASIGYLKKAQLKGLPILAVEYLEPGPDADAARHRLDALGFVPYVATRALNRLRETN